MSVEIRTIFTFDGFVLETEKRLLIKDGKTISLNNKTYDLLQTFVLNRGRLMTKNELLNVIWEGQFVEESNLAVQVSTLRKILGEKKDEHRYILTVPGEGYRFVAEVVEDNKFKNYLFAKDENFESFDRSAFEKSLPPTQKRFFNPQYVRWSIVLVILICSLATLSLWYRKQHYIDFPNPKFTKLTSIGKVRNIALSPNGEYLVFSQRDDEGQSLWLRQSATNSKIRILPPQKVEFLSLIVSPDNNFIYTSVFLDNKADTPLWKIPLLGGAVQEIPNVNTCADLSFSPDGKHFAFTRENSENVQLVIADSDGTNQKILLETEGGIREIPTYAAKAIAWSPDGNEIACAFKVKTDNGILSKISLVDAASGNETLLNDKVWEDIRYLTWIDSENLALINGEDGQIWTTSRKNGETKKITNDVQKYSWLASTNNQLFSIQRNINSSLQVGEFNENVKTINSREIFYETGYINKVAWKANDSILYTSTASGTNEIWQMNSDGSTPTQLTFDGKIADGMAISPQNDSIVFSSNRNGNTSLWMSDIKGKNIHQLTDGMEDLRPEFSPDGKNVVFQRGQNLVPPKVWRINLESKSETKLNQEISLFPVFSPDGTKIAYSSAGSGNDGAWQIALISNKNGELLQKLDLPITVNERFKRWYPNGEFLTQFFNSGNNFNLLFLPTSSKTPEIISNLGKGRVISFDWSKDGKRLVYTVETEIRDVVEIGDFEKSQY
ncbi:MAG: winged helix-turn-helix domain-containing protein [Actinomycetota bacterium]